MSLHVNAKTMAPHTTRLHRNNSITGLPIQMLIRSNCVYFERSFLINFEQLPNRPNIGTTHCRLTKRSESYVRDLRVFELWMFHKSTVCGILHTCNRPSNIPSKMWADACIPCTDACWSETAHTINSQIFTIKMSYAIYWLHCFRN